ncbi:MAG: hypothetical protein HYZ16_01395 [Bacteroidetes bacterium]|jgi:hypothetical protein|nr:hypothetical protein [Bacteroidota bacterium]
MRKFLVSWAIVFLSSCADFNHQLEEEELTISMAPDTGGDDCAASELNDEHVRLGGSSISLDDAHWVEINVLVGNPQGEQYIDDYTDLSVLALNEGYLISEFTLHFNALIAGLSVCSVLKNGSDTDTAVSNANFSDLLALITFYEGESLTPVYSDLIAKLKSDLISHNGDTKAELETFLTN